jgi:hypothetical protein
MFRMYRITVVIKKILVIKELSIIMYCNTMGVDKLLIFRLLTFFINLLLLIRSFYAVVNPLILPLQLIPLMLLHINI